MENTEIKINSEEIEESIRRLRDISMRLGICQEQKLLLEESAGETAQQVQYMYQEILFVVEAMKELVEQTTELVKDGKNKFEQADTYLVKLYQNKQI